MESGNLFQAWIDCAADLRFFLGIGRIIAEFCVPDETVLQTESVDRFSEARSQGHDATNGLRNADGTAGLIVDFAVHRGGGRKNRSILCASGRCTEQQSCRGTNDPSQKLVG